MKEREIPEVLVLAHFRGRKDHIKVFFLSFSRRLHLRFKRVYMREHIQQSMAGESLPLFNSSPEWKRILRERYKKGIPEKKREMKRNFKGGEKSISRSRLWCHNLSGKQTEHKKDPRQTVKTSFFAHSNLGKRESPIFFDATTTFF